MIIRNGKSVNLEISFGGASKNTIAKLLEEQQKNILEAISKSSGKVTIVERNGNNEILDQEENEIKQNSLNKIADVMTTDREGNVSNFDKKQENIKITRKDVSKSVDILKNLE